MLQIKDLSVSFQGSGLAIEQVTLDIASNKTTMLVGETGSGKSVFLSALLRILPGDTLISGEALLDGINLFSLNRKEMRQIWGNQIAYIPQGNGDGMNPLMRIGLQIMEKNWNRKKLAQKKPMKLLQTCWNVLGLSNQTK